MPTKNNLKIDPLKIYQKRKRQKKIIIKLILGYIIILLSFSIHILSHSHFYLLDSNNISNIDCIERNYDENDLTMEIKKTIEEIDNLIKDNNYQVAVKYEDLETHFTYTYRENKEFYGASLIKLVDALYLINKAINNEIDLDTVKLKFTSNYFAANSLYMSKKRIGDEVSLRDLIRYAISVSDNTAHLMLIDYIGFDNLKEYGKSLGADVILKGIDKFGEQTAHDTNIYLEEAYKIIKNNLEYGPFLKEIMGNDHRNSFNTKDIKIYHKYGSWSTYYHDIGLNLDIEYPYAISILTLHEGGNYLEIIQDIHNHIIKLHNLFHTERINYCNGNLN